jgi:hypothetical protein
VLQLAMQMYLMYQIYQLLYNELHDVQDHVPQSMLLHCRTS